MRAGGSLERLDVKTTRGAFDRPLHISLAELKEMAADSQADYRLYRVFDADDFGAKLRISADLKEFARSIVGALSALPAGTVVDAISVDPLRIPFGHPIALTPSDDEGEE